MPRIIHRGLTSLPDNLTVGGGLDLSDTNIINPQYCKLHDGEYKEGKYLYADGILTHVKQRKQIKGYTFYVGKIKGRNVISDGVNYAHCKTLRDGIVDLQFKAAKDRGAEQYSNLTLDSRLSAKDMITMYRVITGACREGTEQFIASLKSGLKEEYTIREAIEITSGQYGAATFRSFFEEKE